MSDVPAVAAETGADAFTARRHDRSAVAILFLIATLFFGDVLVGARSFYMRDVSRYYYPAKRALRETVAGGEFPYWNRYFSAGQPMAANPEHEVFYPFNWLILLPDFDTGFALLILLHIYVCLFAMYCLLRSMQLRPSAAFLGALGFGLGGVYLSYLNLLPYLFCAAWLPLTCLYARRFLIQRNVRDFAIAALFLGLQLLVGEPTTVFQTGLLLGIYALYRGCRDGDAMPGRVRAMARNVAWIGALSAAAFGAGAVQMIPALDHVGDSVRARPFAFDVVSTWSMHPARLAELVYPNVFGHISLDNAMWYWGNDLYSPRRPPFIFSIYPGLFMTALAVAGIAARRRASGFVLPIVAVFVLAAIGSHTPLLRCLYDLGVGVNMRYPEKFILSAMFVLSLFAAQMLDRLLSGDERVRAIAFRFACGTAVVAALIAIVGQFLTPIYVDAFLNIWNRVEGPGTFRMVALSHSGWIAAAARGAVLAVLLSPAVFRRRAAWLIAITLFVCADLGYNMLGIAPRVPREYYTEPPPIAQAFAADRAAFRIFHEAEWHSNDPNGRAYFSTGDAQYWIVRAGLFPMFPASQNLRTVMERDYDLTNLLPTTDFAKSVWEVRQSGLPDWPRPFMAMSNAWFRGNYTSFESEIRRTGGVAKNTGPIRFEAGPAHPRYYFADQMFTIRDRADFVRRLSTARYSDSVAFVAGPAFPPSPGFVRRVTESANRARIEVEAAGQAYLVMSVTPHEYWKVTIDGAKTEAVITNIGYQGVVVPPGRHVVEMQYRNPKVAFGMAVSIGSILLLTLGVLARRRGGMRAHDDLLSSAAAR